ncbi:BTB/POZ domain-containing protein 9 isoform X2 [Peromyscus maniculatus bairdii]|uniref:BTB/POZ domain-containing protein 9 isoform X2 n=1 Tax=Peromyscus maniculatus bairdii TaxID=230844 RepID=UPI001C2E7844|nr:BTB/POZ domain-containing protein 9 isoform X2 [Peromyscus maniculatus bairdii]
MSNSHPLRPFTAVGEIDHVHILSEHIGALLIGEEYGDVTFVVEKKRFPAHRVILAARCQYFRALLYGGMRESQPEAEIPLQDTTAEAFTMLLKYIYTGRATLTDEKEEVLLDFLSLAHKYGFPELEDSTSEYLCTILNIQNVCMTFDVASLYSLPKLTCMCCMFMDRNAQEVLSSEGFLSLSKTALLNIVLRDSFAAPEKDIFLALLNWCKHNAKENHAEIMQAVRLPLMSLTELLNVVRPSGLLSPDAILDAIKVRSESRDMDLNYRGMLIPEENIATMKYGAQVVKGELKSALLDGDTQNYDLDHGFSRHPIDDDCRSGIEIKLGQPSIINHIRLLLWDRDSRSYSYFIEVSMDELDWIRVIDHSHYLCRSWQKLYFPARVCRLLSEDPILLHFQPPVSILTGRRRTSVRATSVLATSESQWSCHLTSFFSSWTTAHGKPCWPCLQHAGTTSPYHCHFSDPGHPLSDYCSGLIIPVCLFASNLILLWSPLDF